MGGAVPQAFRRHQHNTSEYKDLMYMEVEAGSLLSMKYTISSECVMTWRYKIDSGDISFGIKRKKASQNSTSR